MVSTYSVMSSAAGEGLTSEVRSGRSVGSRPVATIEAENPWGSCVIASRVNITTLSTQALAEGPSSRHAGSRLFRVRWLLSLIALPSG